MKPLTRARTGIFNQEHYNSQIELYYANNGAYPANLTTLMGDMAYFPDGAPICPVTEKPYSNALVNNRVDTSGRDPHPYAGADSSRKSLGLRTSAEKGRDTAAPALLRLVSH